MCGNLHVGIGNCNKALRLSGNSNANSLNAMDLEETYVGLEIDGVGVVDNEFNGGKIVAFYPINALSGLRNKGTVQLSIYPGGSYVKTGGEWFWTQNRVDGYSPVAAPVTDVPLQNLSSRRLRVRALGDYTAAVHTKADTNAYGLPLFTGVGEQIDIALMPMDKITLTFATPLAGWQIWPDD